MSLQNIANTILVVEDEPADFHWVQRMFERAGLRNPLVHCETGEQARDFLLGHGAYAGAGPGNPAMVLLDIRLPGISGNELLRIIKSDDRLRALPVIVLTASKDDRDVLAAFQGRADAFLAKPAEFQAFIAALQQLNHHNMQIVLTPRA